MLLPLIDHVEGHTAPRWYERAAFLGERLEAAGGTDPGECPGSVPDAGLVPRWAQACAAGDDARFDRRLTSLGMTRADIARLVRPAAWTSEPPWVAVAGDVAEAARAKHHPPDWDLDERVPFGSLLRPWVVSAVDRLQHGVDRDLDPLRPSLHRAVRLRIRRCGEPAVLEVFRRSGLAYREWIVTQLDDGYAGLFEALPVWGRLVAQAVVTWIDATAEFLEHLGADEALVRDGLLAGDRSPFVGLEPAGDPHAGGRQVMILVTASGRRVVYKPRSLAAEAVVADAARHVRDGGGFDFDPVPALCDLGDHGWMQWVESRPPTPDTMHDYSRRVGGLLALARALAVTDLHDENLVPAGDRPALVDLECLATARPADRRDDGTSDRHRSLLGRSVLGSDLLVDTRRFARDGRDMSGLTGFRVTGEPDPSQSYVWTGLGTDAIDLERRPARRSCDEPTLPLDVDAVVAGLDRAERVIAERGPGVDPSRRVAVRVLVHDTSFYAGLLDRTLDATTLSDGLRYSLALEQVARDATDDEATTWRLGAATLEREMLEVHDIPLFLVDWNDTTGSLGPLEIAELVSEPGTTVIDRRRSDTTPDRRRLQTMVTRSVLDIRLDLARERAGQADIPARGDDESIDLLERPDALDQCRLIAERLERDAVTDDAGGLCWLDLEVPEQLPAPMLTDGGLASGNAGIAVFLAGLARVSGEARWADLARRAVAGSPDLDDDSLYQGRAGRGYALTIVGTLLDDGDVIDRGASLLGTITAPDPGDRRALDVLFGIPGIAGALAAAAITTGNPRLADLSLRHARAAETAWRAAVEGDHRSRTPALRIGVAHGITGIELGAARVVQATGDAGLLSWVEEMVEAENDRVDRRDGVPARLDAVDRRPDRGWCWGLAGYVMARDTIAAVTGLVTAHHAVDTGRRLAADGDGRVDRLCCGRAAQADVLGPENQQLADLLQRPLRWHFEKGTTHQNTSLLRGTSGVGLTLLRSVAPGIVPQPLTLDPMPIG